MVAMGTDPADNVVSRVGVHTRWPGWHLVFTDLPLVAAWFGHSRHGCQTNLGGASGTTGADAMATFDLTQRLTMKLGWWVARSRGHVREIEPVYTGYSISYIVASGECMRRSAASVRDTRHVRAGGFDA